MQEQSKIDEISDRQTLNRAGIALIILGIVDVLFGIYFLVWMRVGYSSPFNLFAIIAGILICRGWKRVAKLFAYLTAFYGAAMALMATVGIWTIVPFDLLPIVFAKYPAESMMAVLWMVGFTGLTIWCQLRLTTGPIVDVYARRPPRPIWKSWIGGLGVVAAIVANVAMVDMLSGEMGQQAIREARQEVGADNKCFVYQLHYSGNYCWANVLAYDDESLQSVEVYWEAE